MNTGRISELAAISRAYQRMKSEIDAAIQSQLKDGVPVEEVAESFGLSARSLTNKLAKRGSLCDFETVLKNVLSDIELGRIGPKLPGEDRFTQIYWCSKRTASRVRKHLLDNNIVRKTPANDLVVR